MKRTPIGSKERQRRRNEEGFYPEWEEMLMRYGLDYWHCSAPQKSQPGWVDYVVMGLGWMAFVEIKARHQDGRAGRIEVAQRRYKNAIELAGGEWVSWLFPDQWEEAEEWLKKRVLLAAK